MIVIGPKLNGVLYHYTSINALYKMVESLSLRASNAYYMNDSSEIKYAIHLFKECINSRVQLGNCDTNILVLLKQLFDWINQLTVPKYIFSFSLSEEGNQLSQWRAYTKHGTGVSIGFNISDLGAYADDNNLVLSKCVYESVEQKNILNSMIDKIIERFKVDVSSIVTHGQPTGQEYVPYLNQFTEELLRCFICIKNAAFREENEWKLISKYYEQYTHGDIQFRSGRTSLIPYVNYKLNDFAKDGKVFEQVFIGPSPNFELAYSAISAYLSNKKICNVTINSLQPYREI